MATSTAVHTELCFSTQEIGDLVGQAVI
jgi:hypothetical protein